jgi:glycosyltransferase 2 family protein
MVEEQRPVKSMNWGMLLRVAAVALVLFLLFRKIDWATLAREVTRADPFWMAAAFLSVGIALVAGSQRWRLLLRVQGIHLPLRRVWQINMIGLFFNQFIPGSTGGDLVKIFYAIRNAPDKKPQAALSMVMDRILGLLAVLGVTFLLIPWEWKRLGANESTRPIIFGLAVILAGVFGSLAAAAFFPLQRLPRVFHRLWQKMPKREIFEDLYHGFHAHGREAGHTLQAAGMAVATVLPVLAIGWFLARALHLDIAPGPMTILFAIVLCAMSVPVIPGGHGLREGAFTLLFPIFHVTREGAPVGAETALACSLLYLGLTLLWTLLGGGVYLFCSHRLKADPHAIP